MPTTFGCLGCKRDQEANPCLKGQQQYCGERECQRERKRAWQQEKRQSDEAYRRRQHAGLVKWRSEDHRLSRYQQQYRETHPKYVEKNRAQQRLRNRARRERDAVSASTKIVKMDASPQAPVTSGLYLLTPCSLDASAKIVKMDAFVVALQVFHGDNASANAAFG